MKFSGQVHNTSATESLLRVKLEGSVYDPAEHFVASSVGYVADAFVAPAAAGQFEFLVADPDRRGSGCKLKLLEAVWRQTRPNPIQKALTRRHKEPKVLGWLLVSHILVVPTKLKNLCVFVP